MKLYLSGAISNTEDYKKRFKEAEIYFLQKGFSVVNPVNLASLAEDLKGNAECFWEDYMKVDLSYLLNCEGIVHLEGWEESRGAKLEALIARELGLKEYFY